MAFPQPRAVEHGTVQLHKQLMAVDDMPLAGRMPLLLVHGIKPAEDEHFNWARFLHHANASADFLGRYKVYLFAYHPSSSVEQAGGQLIRALHDYLAQMEVSSLRVVANSLGGLVYRYAMSDPLVEAVTERVLSVGAPYHGSPLSNPQWAAALFEGDSLKHKTARALLERVYRTMEAQYPDYPRIYRWENYDIGPQVPEVLRQEQAISPPSYYHEIGDKFLNYAGFFGVRQDVRETFLAHLGLSDLKPPREAARAEHWVRKHGMLTLVQCGLLNIRRVAPGYEGGTPPLLVFNDGVTSIPSALWLGRYISADVTDRNQAAWELLGSAPDKIAGRVFAAVDHRNWMEGVTRAEDHLVIDLLHPSLSPRPIFDWYLHDLGL